MSKQNKSTPEPSETPETKEALTEEQKGLTEEQKAAGEGEEQEQAKKKDPKKEALSWILTVFVPVILLLVLNTFVGKLVIVHGSSMYPTLHDQDVMIVQTLAVKPKQGDIVVVTTPEGGALNGENIVKRVIATAGQTVYIDYDSNTVYVDGEALEESYIYQGDTEIDYDPMIGMSNYEVTVPDNCIFVMGDNRNNSIDSRSEEVGMVSLDNLLGKTVLTLKVGRFLSEQEAYAYGG